MNVFIYAADLYCEACGNKIREELTAAGDAPADPNDEHSYDSDPFPKGPYPDAGGESDSVNHCASGEKCLNKLELDEEPVYSYGAWLENELTRDGVRHLQEMINNRKTALTQFWYEQYTDKGYSLTPPPSDGEDNDGDDDNEPNDDMDGDHASALASAGLGTDEDYNGGDYPSDDAGCPLGDDD